MNYKIKSLLLTLVVVSTLETFAQVQNVAPGITVLPLREFLVIKDQKLDYDENVYVKDVEGDLDKFIGTWKGTTNDKTFEITVAKFVKLITGTYFDALQMKYKVVDSTGNTIINTYNLSNDNYLVLTVGHLTLDRVFYSFFYQGENSGCGAEEGDLIFKEQTNPNQMKLYYFPDTHLVIEEDCPNGYSTVEIFPVSMDLIKQ